MKKIVVIGAGPAGVVSAIGLKKLGYEVVLLCKRRPFDAIEGFSHRSLEGLHRAGCFNALKSVGQYLPRNVTWNNKSSQTNHEYIVHRKAFDEALLLDATSFGIEVVFGAGKVIDKDKALVEVQDTIIEALFIVDARGRFAPRNSLKKSKPTSAFLIKYKKHNNQMQTALSTSPFGWIWQAQDGKNMNYIQLTSDSKQGKANLKTLLKKMNKSELINHKVTIREASSYVAKDIIENNYMKVGDAACAVDPLSGNGVFQSLSTALITPYVIHTLLEGTREDKQAAKDFFIQRVHDIFYRYTRMGREFYEMEQQFKTKFWKERSIWPDFKDSHQNIKEVSIKQGSVLVSPFIKSHEVVITNDNPMGVWKLGSVDLVDLTKKLLTQSNSQSVTHVEEYCETIQLSQNEKNALFHWCQKNKLIA